MQIETKLPKVGTTIFTVMSQLALEHKAVNLGQGFPDFDGPQAMRDALAAAMNAGRNQYAPMTGLPALREQIARKTEALYGRKVNQDTEITVTSGATEALFAAIAAVVRPGDEVIVLDPCYDSYEPAIELNGGRAVHVPLDPSDFSPDWQRVRDAITPKTRMIVVNSPHNPCGAVFTPDDLDALADVTRERGILVLSDEVYEHIVFDGRPHQSVLRHAELAERSFVVSSFGKTFHCTGWKVGYCIAPRALSAEFRKVHQYLTFCTFTPAQGRVRRDPREGSAALSRSAGVLSGEARSFSRAARRIEVPAAAGWRRVFPGRRLFGARRSRRSGVLRVARQGRRRRGDSDLGVLRIAARRISA